MRLGRRTRSGALHRVLRRRLAWRQDIRCRPTYSLDPYAWDNSRIHVEPFNLQFAAPCQRYRRMSTATSQVCGRSGLRLAREVTTLNRSCAAFLGHTLDPPPSGDRTYHPANPSDLVSQLAMTQLFVHKGGLASTWTALRSGTPQLILPPCIEMANNAALAARLSPGVFIQDPRDIALPTELLAAMSGSGPPRAALWEPWPDLLCRGADRGCADALRYDVAVCGHSPKNLAPVELGKRVWAHVHDVLYRRTRELEGRDESPTAAIIDSQSVKTGAEAREMVGYDAGKRVKGRKRHLVTDTLGLMLRIEVHSASVQDRDGAALVLDRITRRFPFLERIFADAGYQGPRVAAAAPRPVEIIKRTDTGFVVQPKRWVIERTFAWACINRRLARDVERAAETVKALFQIAMIKLMTRRIARFRDFCVETLMPTDHASDVGDQLRHGPAARPGNVKAPIHRHIVPIAWFVTVRAKNRGRVRGTTQEIV